MSMVGPGTLMMASAAIQSVGTAYNIRAQKSALAREQVRYERERKVAELDAIEQENIRKDMMNQAIADNMAVQSTAGYFDDSRSFLNMNKQVQAKAEKDISNIRLQGRLVSTKYKDQMFENQVAAKANVFGGYVSIMSGLTNGYGNYQWYEGVDGKDKKWWKV